MTGLRSLRRLVRGLGVVGAGMVLRGEFVRRGIIWERWWLGLGGICLGADLGVVDGVFYSLGQEGRSEVILARRVCLRGYPR